jgi:glycylpeptide N-tetradecanoyltransferase
MQLHVGVRVTATRKLVGFITGIPVEVRVYKNDLNVVEINFLCVHKKLRSKRLAPVLIKEVGVVLLVYVVQCSVYFRSRWCLCVGNHHPYMNTSIPYDTQVTRRTHLRDEWQAVYTAGVVLPKPVAANQYWHRSLNPKKLIEIGFSRLRPRMTMNQTIKLFKLPATPDIAGMRLMEEKDHVQCHAMLVKYLQKFDLTQVYSLAEFKHWFSPRPNVIWTYVVEDPESKQITDFASFYNLPSTVLGNSRHDTLRAAYSYYNVAVKTPLEDLVRNVMVCARNEGMDVFNCLDLMDNKEFLKPLKFGAGDGNLQYYLYNWRCPEIASEKVGLVLL